MMSEEPHLLRHHHHHHFNDFSTIAGNSIPSTISTTFDNAANHSLFTMDIPAPNPTWRSWPEPPPAAAQPAIPWPIEPPLHPNQIQTQTQTLSLSLYNPPQPPSSFPFHLKNSKYLLPTQELLNEFCSLAAGASFKRNPRNDDDHRHSGRQSLYSMEPLELQKRKAKLLSMLEEVDRRYRRYCEQMKAVVSSFEEVAGDGAAGTYSVLASKAMSRHFRCLRDGISAEIKATRKAMGENDASAVAPGQTRGETPRLKLLDQCLRQHKAFQQAGMMETHPWRPQRGLPERSVSILRAWLFEHFLHPYPSDVDKHILARQTGLSRGQVSNWFINARVRLWKPMVEDMYLEELKEEEKNSHSSNAAPMQEVASDRTRPYTNPNPNPSPSSQPHFEEQQYSLSSIINNLNPHHHAAQNPNPNNLSFGSYSGHELTLGLQPHERPLLFSRDDEEDEEYSIMAGDGQNIPYRNLIGAQLLHHLAG
ncbi:hypothetical protein KSP39_PZI011303 [Platanthera zijinensis]|uniref:Homeobox domain-containing protein n=1 Tax=Platanthera zijinensis TaxID=2320716 RepID=A0AAP0G5S2_9ASPA